MTDSMRRRDAGYTLTEMLVVLIIIGLIAAAVTPAIIGQLDRARVRTARLQLDTVSAALEMLHGDLQRYPTNEEGLQALVQAPSNAPGWLGPYVRNADQIKDPWGRPFVYRIDDEAGAFTLKSLGADGREGGEGVRADIALDVGSPLPRAAEGQGAKAAP
jgi:general secretion pathway protein G